ncbi:hypothetical protein JKP88DRAFT_182262 [Tribonema minus]|nr:hypothetical protein JKP88DRAFT_182262 [Tribonema minus]
MAVSAQLLRGADGAAAVRRGLASIVPAAALSLLTGAELQTQVCGCDGGVDIALLRANTEYDEGVSPHDAHITSLWRVLEAYSSKDRGQFLRFVWARSRLPLHSRNFRQKFKIQVSNLRICVMLTARCSL